MEVGRRKSVREGGEEVDWNRGQKPRRKTKGERGTEGRIKAFPQEGEGLLPAGRGAGGAQEPSFF